MSSFKNKAFNGTFWTFSEQLGVKGISFIVQILIARLLIPEDFGLIAMIAVFIAFGDLLVDSGLGQSLIRTKNPQQADYSTVFYINVFSSFIIYSLIFSVAPLVADFYDRPELLNILRVFSVAIIFGSFSVVQKAILTIDMNFKKQMLIQIPSLVISSLIGLVLAYKDYGVWAIVAIKISYPFFSSLIYWFQSKWRPIFMFDLDKLKYHYLFGYKLMLTYIIDAFFNNIYSVLIGKNFSTNTLGFYNRATTFQRFPTVLVGKSISRVAYPLFTKIDGDNVKQKNILMKLNKIIVFLFVPLMLFLVINANEIIIFLLTYKWSNITPFFQILCFGSLLEPINHYYGSLINSHGDSSLVLKIVSYSRILTVIGLPLIIKYGVYPLVVFQAINMLFLSLSFMYFGGHKLKYNLIEQFTDLVPEIIMSTLVSLLIYLFNKIMPANELYSVTINFLSFIFFYVTLGEIFKIQTYFFVKQEIFRLKRS